MARWLWDRVVKTRKIPWKVEEGTWQRELNTRGNTGRTRTWPLATFPAGLSSPEITSRPQLCFSSRPRKAAKPGGQCQNQLQWLKTPCPATDQSVETTTLEGDTWRTNRYSTETLPWDLPWDSQERDKSLRTKDPACQLSLWGASSLPHSLPFLLSPLLSSQARVS